MTENSTETKDSFVWYRSFKKCASALPIEDRCALYEGIMDFGLDHTEPEFSNPFLRMVWAVIQPQLEANWKRYKNGKKGGKYGYKGGGQVGNQNARKYPKRPQNDPKTTPNVNVNVNENVNECIHAHASEKELSSQDEKRLREFERLLEEKAPSFARSASPITLSKLNELKAHASADDIIEVMEEIENKVAGDEVCRYADVATTIRTFLQTKNVWKRKES